MNFHRLRTACLTALALLLGGCGGATPAPAPDVARDMEAPADTTSRMDAVPVADAPSDMPDATGCAAGEVRCEGVCTAVVNDPSNCGACGVACPAGQICAGGQCDCPPNRSLCGTSCRDLANDPATCGACGTACGGATPFCVAGACAAVCAGGRTACGGRCVDTRADASHCGACDQACPAAQGCLDGTCLPCSTPGVDCGARSATVCGATACAGMHAVFDSRCSGSSCVVRSCAAGYADCDGSGNTGCETRLGTPLNCGACGQVCAPEQVCAGTSCQPSCPTGQVSCAGSCRDLRTDAANCGFCARSCASGQGCSGGQCCPTGQTSCDGTCRALQTDAANCGACGRTCLVGQTCVAGACTGTGTGCPTGRANCDGDAATGCEVELASSEGHCGACGRPCAAGQTCCAGACRDLQSDRLNCGACDRPCAGRPCVAGRCDNSAPCQTTCDCPAGYLNCLAESDGACQTRTTTYSDCGACGRPCLAGQSCVSGACAGTATGGCPAGHGNCDGNAANGCEANLAVSPNCGACGRTCAAGQTCCGGTCRALATDVLNCGACGRPCLAGQTCVAGACAGAGTVCPPFFADCDRASTNGCEADLLGDERHCGACGLACFVGQRCEGGVCTGSGASCPTGLANCDGSAANGCETNLDTSAQHCGSCAISCGALRCSGGRCTSCPAGTADCGEDPTTPCSTNLLTSPLHCGACGHACAVGQACCAGSCLDVQRDRANCGACGRACAAGQTCCAGSCRSLQTDVASCGVCDRHCFAGQSCSAGSCAGAGTSCPAGYSDCDGSASTGCEVHTAASQTDCGTCSNSCGRDLLLGQYHCCNGRCTSPRYLSCDGDTTNGCETDSSNNVNNCGACGRVCPSYAPMCCSGRCVEAWEC